MKSAVKFGALAGVAILAVAMVGKAVADEGAGNTLQQNWNDYPAKWIDNSKQVLPATVTHSGGVTSPDTAFLEDQSLPSVSNTAEPSVQIMTPDPLGVDGYPEVGPRPSPRIPIQQQQTSSGGSSYWGGGKTGGGYRWGGGKTGGGFSWGGGKTGGSFGWGKTSPPQSQQSTIPSFGQGTPDRDQLLGQIAELQRQNAMLKELLQRLAEQQAAAGDRSTGLSNAGVPID